jgi:PPOX class probable F420-dependent enzyme
VRKNLTPDDLRDFLAQPFVATLATYRRDGAAMLSPVWHEWHEGGFNVPTGEDDVKARHLRRDPRAGFVLYDNNPPYRGVELRCQPRIVPDPDRAVLRRIAVRYLGPERGNAYADSSTGPSVVIRLEPGEWRAWDFADDDQLA